MKLYGMSTINGVIELPSGRKIDLDKGRYAAPGYGNEDRTLPVVDTDHPADLELLRRGADGWSADPELVPLSQDEIQAQRRAERLAATHTAQLMEGVGRGLAEQVARGSVVAEAPAKRGRSAR